MSQKIKPIQPFSILIVKETSFFSEKHHRKLIASYHKTFITNKYYKRGVEGYVFK